MKWARDAAVSAAQARKREPVIMQDYYKILEVSPTATSDEIKRSYRRLARQYHPDLNSGQDSQIKRLNEAYEVLRNPLRRAAYDEQRAETARRAAVRRQRAQAKREPEMTW